ncbi:MAG: LysM peptidoglycan-binding domain-containing protein, partial [Candidatus Saccharibacteria bacterium]
MADIKGQTETVKKRRKSKFKIKPSLIAIYASVFILVVAIIFVGYQRPTNDAVVANAIDTANNSPSVDDVVATKIAAVVAEGIDLSIAPNVSSLAISTEAKIQFDQVNNVSSSKPQIVGVVASNRLVSKYTVLAGDTVDTIAAQFKISKDTLKWANNMIYDNLTVGKELKILPIDGVLYDVKAGDTVESIATKYKVDQNRLVIYNDLDVSGLQPNTQIILPSAD